MGARLTMTPRGTSCITVGSQGFYYRESLSQRRANPSPAFVAPTVVPAAPSSHEIATANLSGLVDGSSEALIERLSERARMFNPACTLYTIAAAMSIAGLAVFSTHGTRRTLHHPSGRDIPIQRRTNRQRRLTHVMSQGGTRCPGGLRPAAHLFQALKA